MHSAKALVQKPEGFPEPQRYLVHFSLTQGELLALKYALENYQADSQSSVAEDLNAYLNNGSVRSGINAVRKTS